MSYSNLAKLNGLYSAEQLLEEALKLLKTKPASIKAKEKDMPIFDYDFGPRITNAIKNHNESRYWHELNGWTFKPINNLSDLCEFTEKELLLFPNMGRVSVDQIKHFMNYHGFNLKP
jgi:DNA-directed RNA polymerase alpha subunit